MITDEAFAKLIPSFRAHGCTCNPSYVIDFERDPDGNEGFVVHEAGCPLDRPD